ncbi:MAG: hypothetical protein AB1938_29205 [Myxococcota bacterium]
MELEEHIARWKEEGLITEEVAAKLKASSRAIAMPQQMGLFTIAGVANGIALVLFALLYSVPLATHVLLLLWMLSLLPLLYLARSRVLAGLVGLVFVLWLPLFSLREAGVAIFAGSSVMPIVFLMGGTALFGLGGLHYVIPAFAPVARGLRIVALVTVTLALFVLGLSFWSSRSGGPMVPLSGGSLWTSVVGLGVFAAVMAIAGMVARRRAPMITAGEGPVSLGLIGVGLAYFLVPLPGWIFVVGFNVLTVAMLGVLLLTGWKRADLRAIDIANIGLLAVFITRWIDLGLGNMSFGAFLGAGLTGFLLFGGALVWKRHSVVEAARAKRMGQPVPEPTQA